MHIDTGWDVRLARARQLAAQHPAAAELLIFYAALAEYQKSLLGKEHNGASGFGLQALGLAFFELLNLDSVLTAIPDFLSWLSRVAPVRLSEAATELRQLDRADWGHLAHSYLACPPSAFLSPERPRPARGAESPSAREWGWGPASLEQGGEGWGEGRSNGHDFEEADEPQLFVLEALLQPFAEQVAIRIASASISARGAPPPLAAAPRLEDSLVAAAAGASRIPNPESRIPSPESLSRCPICGGLPVLGVLREEGHGARRTLLCALCLTEWGYLRVVCPGCGEQQFDVLPVYSADQFAHVRIEACDRCRRYLKTIDLTKDGLAVPLVDDIASVSLDLWARERGYTRLRSNLLKM